MTPYDDVFKRRRPLSEVKGVSIVVERVILSGIFKDYDDKTCFIELVEDDRLPADDPERYRMILDGKSRWAEKPPYTIGMATVYPMQGGEIFIPREGEGPPSFCGLAIGRTT